MRVPYEIETSVDDIRDLIHDQLQTDPTFQTTDMNAQGTILSEVGPAASAVELQQLDDIVRRLQSIQPRLDGDLAACKVKTDIATPSAEASASSTPSPAATPTG